ncbi:hypothetical protein EI94DRAFT_1704734 [Lactarius quietus]|nr:hypothetical protein EI94DRAFT_1704734 [Lactarius quietus]
MLAQPSCTSTTAIGGTGRVHAICTLLHACILRLCLSVTAMHVVGTCGVNVSCKVGVGMGRDGDMCCGEFKPVSIEQQKKEKGKTYKNCHAMWVWVGTAQHGNMRCGEFKPVSKGWQKKEREKKNIHGLFGQLESACKVAWSMSVVNLEQSAKKGKTKKKRMNHGARTLTMVPAMTMHQDGADRETTDGLRRLSSLLQDMIFSMLEAEEGRGSEEGRSEKGKEEH